MKTCSKCQERKAISEFSRHRVMKDGRQAWCKKCLSARNKEWFAKHPDRKRELNRRWRDDNAERVTTLRREWYRANSDKVNARKRAWYARQSAEALQALRRKGNLSRYGLTVKAYHELLDKQGGGCAVCGTKPRKRRLSVDHCHDTNAVRGILCDGCNIGIGCMGDSPGRLRAAAAYLESFERSAEE